MKPPEYLVTQLDLYTEEKYDDEEYVRNRAYSSLEVIHERGYSDMDEGLRDVIRLAKQHGELYSVLEDILARCGSILQRDTELSVSPLHHASLLMIQSRQFKTDVFSISDRFMQQASLLPDL